jgi:hypothetical protein
LRQGNLLKAGRDRESRVRRIAEITAGCSTAGRYFLANSYRKAFIARSSNKSGGTADIGEHRSSPLVVGDHAAT